jgi:formylglycine-generating enzyme required for sulfatase activity
MNRLKTKVAGRKPAKAPRVDRAPVAPFPPDGYGLYDMADNAAN